MNSRPVLLHAKPKAFIEDITVNTEVINDIGVIKYRISIAGLKPNESFTCDVNLVDVENKRLVKGGRLFMGIEGVLKVVSPNLWWPRSMDENPGYMYTLEVIHKLYSLQLFFPAVKLRP